MKPHQKKSESRWNSQRTSNSSAVRWSDSSAASNSFATIIRDSVFIVAGEDDDFEPLQAQPNVHRY
jgi:hypothetical protein